MANKAYHNFKDIHGNEYGFDNYMDFAVWWFDQMRKTLVAYFDAETFKRLNYAATQSTEAKERAY